ncbi:D-alanyl-lipoteichoic acid biosynthesis protein DltD [Clostridium sp.]|uniref:D-alanyl-lipoteichoic acid biosynthesis protein DltD n=1 Tax=Clostridium sp. TaxID=1506 RepID=UPI002906BD67|nr:D-alanyl-lipoteichoic acid biosynthesis protein DltD [Clostridium sp.]MDU5106496.1 D-alanyl-lipoteichoic acid biosynthesis protein DltD [Clostridium sp.]
MRKYKFFFIPIICIFIFANIFNRAIDKKYKDLIEKKDLTSIKHTYNQIIRDRGGVLKNQMKEEGDLMLLGSSELSSPVEQNPTNIFPFDGAEYDVSIYGRAYTQSLQHATILNNIKNINRDDKVAIVISAQWFASSIGIDGGDFSVNFSEQQFYDFFNNENISKENKIYYAKRISELLRKAGEYGEERIYANLYYRNNFLSKSVLTLLKPYYSLKEYMLDTKDKVQTIKLLNKMDDKSENQLKDIHWDKEYEKAENQGKDKVTNNNIFVDDEYYDTYLREKYDTLKDSWANVNLLESKEVKDYDFLLKVCKENNVKPLIILMPVNGLYYDHLGLKLDKRTEFYSTLGKMANDKGFDVLNLQNKEYEKYYLSDVMHLGWKGWLNIDEEISKYFNKK